MVGILSSSKMKVNQVPLTKPEFEKIKDRIEEYHVYGTREGEFKPKSFAELPECISGIVYEPGSFDDNFFVQVLGNCHNSEISVEKFDGRCECIKLTEGELDYGFKVIVKFKDKSENEKRIEFRVNLGALMNSGGIFRSFVERRNIPLKNSWKSLVLKNKV